jgi:hypothetical protein
MLKNTTEILRSINQAMMSIYIDESWEMNRVWIELNWIELNWIELNWIELNWIELNTQWFEIKYTNRIEREIIGQHILSTQLNSQWNNVCRLLIRNINFLSSLIQHWSDWLYLNCENVREHTHILNIFMNTCVEMCRERANEMLRIDTIWLK